MGDTGLEPPSVTHCGDKHLGQPGEASAAESGAFGPENAAIDPDLQAVIDGWPTLPGPVRVGIVAMVRAAAQSGE